MACSRNVDPRVCIDDVADLASWFVARFIACRCCCMWGKKFMLMFLKFGVVCMHNLLRHQMNV